MHHWRSFTGRRLLALAILTPLVLAFGCGRDRSSLDIAEEPPGRDTFVDEQLVDGVVPAVGAPSAVVPRARLDAVKVEFASNAMLDAGVPDAMPVSTASQRMAIRSGHATLQVDSLDAAVTAVREAAASMDGHVANLSLMTGPHQVRSATIHVRVPASAFDALLSRLSSVGDVEGLSVQTQDVGEEFVDVEARVLNDKRMEARLLELLDRRTGDLTDVLTVERELARVRSDIERAEGRLRYLQERTRLSAVVIDLHEAGPLLTRPAGPNPLLQGIREGWSNLIAVSAALMAFTGSVLPFLGLALVIWFCVRRLRAWSAFRRTA